MKNAGAAHKNDKRGEVIHIRGYMNGYMNCAPLSSQLNLTGSFHSRALLRWGKS